MEGIFECKLNAVFTLLKKKEFAIKDDTYLEKLFDVMYSEGKCHILDESRIPPNMLELISLMRAITTSPTSYNSSLVAFCIKLCGVTIPSVSLESNMELLLAIFNHDLLKDLTIAVSYYHTLCNHVKENVAMMKRVLPWSDILEQAWTNLRDGRSIYLSKESCQFLIQYLNSTESNTFSATEEKIIHSIASSIKTSVKEFHSNQCNKGTSRLVKQTLDIMTEATESFIALSTEDITGQLLLFLHSCEIDLVLPAIQCLFKFFSVRDNAGDILKISQLVHDVGKSDVLKAQKMATVHMSSHGNCGNIQSLEYIFTLPLQIVCGKEAGNAYSGILTQIQHSGRCVDVVCHTLQCIVTNKLKLVTLKDLMIEVFELATLESKGPITTYKNSIVGNRKIILKCLDYISQGIPEIYVERVLKCLTTLLKSQEYHVIFAKSLQCMMTFFPMILQEQTCLESRTATISSMTTSLQLQLSSIQWENRDSTLHFLLNILKDSGGCNDIKRWIKENKYLLYIYQGISDGESYVRASAIQCLSVVLQYDDLRESLLSVTQTDMETLIERIITIIETDSEAFPRREAITLIVECWEILKTELLNIDNIFLIISTVVSKDFDWEVKLGAVKFWRNLAFNTNSNNWKQIMNVSNQTDEENIILMCKMSTFLKKGGMDALLTLANDYDDSVKENALRTLLDVQCVLTACQDKFVCEALGTDNTNIPKALTQLEEREIDLELQQMTKSKDNICDEYISLLDDILSISCEMSDEEDNVIDCY